MSVLLAVIEVLKKAGVPLHAKDIANQIIAEGLWNSSGKTPEATVSARLYTDIKNNNDKSSFVKVGPQTFMLRERHGKLKNLGSTTEVRNSSSTKLGFSFADCAQKVLEEGDKKPMHYKDITQRAFEKGWLVTSGKTPDATMYAQVITEIKRQQKRGERPRFVQHGRGYVGLSQWLEHGLTLQIEQHNQKVRQALHEHLLTMKPREFEELVAQLVAEMGLEDVKLTRLSGDGGIDVRGILMMGEVVLFKIAIQVKRKGLKKNVHAPIVQQVRGSLGVHERGLIITTSDFSSGAAQEAEQPNKIPIALMNGEQFVTLLMEHDIGVRCSTSKVFEFDEESLTMRKALSRE